MTPALRTALAAFDRISGTPEADSMTFAERIRRAIAGTDCTFDKLCDAIGTSEGAKG